MRTAACIAAALGVTMLASATVHAATIKLATWNMNNLHHVIGEPLRDRAPARSEEDYATLREYRDRVGADIYALQEVNGPKAAALVFPQDEWDTYFSALYIDNLVTGKATHPDPEQRSDRIYTGFAVRRGVFDAVSKRDVPSLGVIHAADGRPVRWGTEILLGEGWAAASAAQRPPEIRVPGRQPSEPDRSRLHHLGGAARTARGLDR